MCPPSTYLELVNQVFPQNLCLQEIPKVSNFAGCSLSSKREEKFSISSLKALHFGEKNVAFPQRYAKIADLGQNFLVFKIAS